jgi:hypothetical protein
MHWFSEECSVRSKQGKWFPMTLGIALCGAFWVTCCLPMGNEELPDAGPRPDGVIIRLLVSSEDRKPGGIIPVTVEAAEEPLRSPALPKYVCARMAGGPGKLSFVFSDGCEKKSSADGSGGHPIDASTAPMQDASSDATSESNGVSEETNDGLSTDEGCLSFSEDVDGWRRARNVAAYEPKGEETSATLFAALYSTPDCSGAEIATTKLVVKLIAPASEEEEADAGTDASTAQDGAADEPDSGMVNDAGGD